MPKLRYLICSNIDDGGDDNDSINIVVTNNLMDELYEGMAADDFYDDNEHGSNDAPTTQQDRHQMALIPIRG